MNFGDFLGNDGIKQRLNEAERAGRLSHAWLLIGPEGSGRHTLARQLIAAMQCTADGERPCMRCTACKKVLSDMHPDVITVDAPDKKTIPVKLVRDACADLFVRPNEGARKIYLFPRAHELNAQGQNALLKCIEEPPPYGTFFLLSEQPLLPTVQSRCVELRLCPLPEATLLRALGQRAPSSTDAQRRTAAAQSEGYLGRALKLLEAGGGLLPQTEALVGALGSKVQLLSVLIPMERMTREALRAVLLQWRELVAQALLCRAGATNGYPQAQTLAARCTAASLLADADALAEALSMLDGNVGPAHLCGWLAVKLSA